MAPVSVAPVQISDEKGANRKKFPTIVYNAYLRIFYTFLNVSRHSRDMKA